MIKTIRKIQDYISKTIREIKGIYNYTSNFIINSFQKENFKHIYTIAKKKTNSPSENKNLHFEHAYSVKILNPRLILNTDVLHYLFKEISNKHSCAIKSFKIVSKILTTDKNELTIEYVFIINDNKIPISIIDSYTYYLTEKYDFDTIMGMEIFIIELKDICDI